MRSIPPAMPEGGGVCVLVDHILLFSFPTRKGPPPGVHADMPSPEKGFLDNRMEPQVEGVVYIRARPLTFRLRGVACRNDVDPGKSRVINERVL